MGKGLPNMILVVFSPDIRTADVRKSVLAYESAA